MGGRAPASWDCRRPRGIGGRRHAPDLGPLDRVGDVLGRGEAVVAGQAAGERARAAAASSRAGRAAARRRGWSGQKWRSWRRAWAWKVRAITPGWPRPRIRSTISPAALSVKVTSRTWSGGTTPVAMAYAARRLMTRVLPVPAPARMTSGPLVAWTASRWASFRSSSSRAGSGEGTRPVWTARRTRDPPPAHQPRRPRSPGDHVALTAAISGACTRAHLFVLLLHKPSVVRSTAHEIALARASRSGDGRRFRLSEPFFTQVRDPIPFEGLDSQDPFAFKVYDPGPARARQAHGGAPPDRRLRLALVRLAGHGHVRRRHVRPAVARRPRTRWTRRAQKMAAAFEFLAKLGVPYYCFHDRDVAPEGATFAEIQGQPRRARRRRRGLPGADGHPAPVGHRQPVHAPALRRRRRHEPRPGGLRLRRGAGQPDARGHPAAGRHELRPVGRPRGLRHAAQHGPEREGDQLARFLHLVAEHKHKIGFEGRSSSSPSRWSRPSTSTTTTPRPSTASWSATGSRASTSVNIEANHATLAGHSFHHEVAYAVAHGILGSIDANRGDHQNGWDTDQFPNSVEDLALPSTRSWAAAASRPAASTSMPSCAARASTATTCSMPTSAASTRSPGPCWWPRTCSSAGRLRSARGQRYAGLGRCARHEHPRRRAVARVARGQVEAGEHRPDAGLRRARSCSRAWSTGASGPPTALSPMALRPRDRRLDDRDQGRPHRRGRHGRRDRRRRVRLRDPAAALERAGPGALVGRDGRGDPVGARDAGVDGAAVAASGSPARCTAPSCSTPPTRASAGDPVERPANGPGLRRDPGGGRTGAPHRDHRQRRPAPGSPRRSSSGSAITSPSLGASPTSCCRRITSGSG